MRRTLDSALALGSLALLGAAAAAAAPTPPAGGGDPRVVVPPVPPVGALGGPETALSGPDMDRFLRGRALFDRNFHRTDGLGLPELNADSCRACHRDPVMGGAGPLELNVSRFAFDNGGAGPYQDLPGGQAASKLRPPYVVGREEYDPLTADVFEQRQTPPLFGGGLITEIFDAEILAHEDPSDSNGDGIRGIARMVNTGGPTPEVGKFGWKAQIPRVGDFVRDALGGECGITTPDDGRGFAFVSDADPVPDPELSQADLDDLVFFLENLAAPRRVGSDSGAVQGGEMLFLSIGCAVCHVPALQAPSGPVGLYSDLLLHDVMPPSFRGMSEPGAEVGLYRTPPLWGIRLTAPYMHDGRAETLSAAILAHDGEAASVRDAYFGLSPVARAAVIAFLEDL